MDTNKEPYTLLPLPPSYLRGRRKAFASAVEVLVELIDLIDGDPDLETIDEREPDGDEADGGWIEWSTMRGSQKRGPNIAGGHEDDEDDDPLEDDDPGGCEHDGRELDDGV